MIISPQSLDTNLSQLLDEVNSGKTQLPEFQRDWTWDYNRIRGIIASLSQGYPMGAIMRLQYGNPDIKFKYRTIKGVGNRDVTPDFLVLDGQQRLTSIYQATYSRNPVETKTDKGKEITRYYYLSMEKCMDENEDRYDAVFSVPADRKIKENFDRDVRLDHTRRGSCPRHHRSQDGSSGQHQPHRRRRCMGACGGSGNRQCAGQRAARQH